ncbi:MAG TPA: DNA-directed RNA polymerase subunit alpha [Candidatus Pacearchaeota archaeon]|jgi:DNA-directed RNA polymerase subunit alpha|nr:DNA-directed RNA polymerase subunit alpha [Candidatus Pacearchaeota archaeon]HRT18277.1 DNA-directed RNA polymerase subunit alpha [Candidatus Paceibacterota bacterium]
MIPLPTSIKTKNISNNNSVFEIESLYPGYGVTLGNAIRRVLLSSLSGAAVTEVKIKDAPHEFATLKGVKEDVLHILMNIKQLRFKIFTEDPQTATLVVKGEKEVTGKDFELPADLKLANPDLHIATLTDKSAQLEIEIKVEKGMGYVFEDKEIKRSVGVIGMDAIFTPIKKVNYVVENMRVGKRTDFDKLSLEVETDGTITPKEALSQSLDILVSQFQYILENMATAEKKETKKKK